MIFVLLVSAVSAQECDVSWTLKQIALTGAKVYSLDQVDPYGIYDVLKSYPEKRHCTCSLFRHLNERKREASHLTKNPYFEIIGKICQLELFQSFSSSNSCNDPNALSSWVLTSPLSKAIADYNRQTFKHFDLSFLDVEFDGTTCSRSADSILTAVLHHTSETSYSRNNLSDSQYKAYLKEAFGDSHQQVVADSRTRSRRFDDIFVSSPKDYVQVLHAEHQKGTRRWAAVAYHYIVSFSKTDNRWITSQGRSPYLVGSHAGAVQSMASYPLKFKDLEWKRKTLSSFFGEKTLPNRYCYKDGKINALPIRDNWNDFSLGIAIKGHFIPSDNPDISNTQFPPGLENHLMKLMEQLKVKFPRLQKLVRHGDVKHTICPGELGGEIGDNGNYIDPADRGIVGKLDKYLRTL